MGARLSYRPLCGVQELELLMMHNKQYAAEIAHNVSARKRAEIVERAVSGSLYPEFWLLPLQTRRHVPAFVHSYRTPPG